jgi:hypothetical protein
MIERGREPGAHVEIPMYVNNDLGIQREFTADAGASMRVETIC